MLAHAKTFVASRKTGHHMAFVEHCIISKYALILLPYRLILKTFCDIALVALIKYTINDETGANL